MAITSGSSWLAGSGLGSYNPNKGALPVASSALSSVASYVPPAPTTTYVSVPTPPVVAGLEPQQYEAILYGKDIPLFIGGKMLIGGRICEGPFFGGTQADPTVSFIAYHASNIVPETTDTTIITSARLRGQEVWNADDGYIATDKLPSGGFAWEGGGYFDLNQPFAQSVARYGANAVGYHPGIVSSWENIPLKPFGGIVPFPSVLVENSAYGDPDDGITRSQAIINILHFMRLRDFEYEVDVSGSDPAWMLGAQMSLEDFLRQLRAIFPNYRITHTDKLRIIEPDSFQVDANITNSNVQRGTLKFKRTDPLLIPREKRYKFINVERDYEMDVAVAKEDRYPIPTTDAAASTTIELPIATTAAQAVADVHNSLYEELSVRSQMEGVVDRTLFGMEVGDGVRFADSSVIDMTARVMEAVHDFENYTVQFNAGEVINCGIVVPVEAEFVNHYENGSTSATQSFSIDFGGLAEDTVIGMGGAGTTNNRTVVSITLDTGAGPQAVNIHDQDTYAGLGGFNDVTIFLASVLVLAGTTTATLVVTYSGLLDGSFVDLYELPGADPSGPVEVQKTSVTGASNPSITIDTPSQSAIIGVFAATDTTFEGSVLNFGPVTWTGISTENSDEVISSSGGVLWGSTAAQDGLSSTIGRTVSATNVVEGRKALMVGVWANAAT